VLDEYLKIFIRKMPKIELHLHLEGSIHPQTALDFMRRNNSVAAPKSASEIRELYRFSNLTEFVKGMRTVSDNIRHLEDLQRVTCELLDSLISQNVRYVEFDCAFQKYFKLGFSIDEVIEAIYSCARQKQNDHSIEVRLVVNLLRSHGPDSAVETVEKVIGAKHPFIVGVGLSGDESKYPQSLFTDAFELAKRHNIHRTVHAGEAMGASSVWDAILLLGAERIDHGTRSIEDEQLVRYLVEKQIPLTQCITSNILLGVVKDIKSHPFASFYRDGVAVTLNTDDPQVFNTSLQDEYYLVAEAFRLHKYDFAKIVFNGIYASFANEETKKQLYDDFENEIKNLIEQTQPFINL